MDTLYLELEEVEMKVHKLAVLLPLEKALLSALVHTLRLGVYLHQQNRLGKANLSKLHLDRRGPSAQICQKYIASALSSDLASDKLFPLRRTGPSMQFIMAKLPTLDSALSIFQLCIWRTFAFGNADYMKQLTLGLSSTTPDLPSIASTITKWGKGPFHLPLFAYGQLQIIKKNILDMLSKLWHFSEDTFGDFIARGTSFGFADLRARLGNLKISTVPHYGLISWVLVSDFYEYGICLEPTTRDLADHITQTNARGAKRALELVAEQTGELAPDNAGDRAILVQHVLEILQHPPENTTILKVIEDCEKIQGRKLGVIDIEHALCKITRQNSRANAGKSRGESEGSKTMGRTGQRKRTTVDVGTNIETEGDETAS